MTLLSGRLPDLPHHFKSTLKGGVCPDLHPPSGGSCDPRDAVPGLGVPLGGRGVLSRLLQGPQRSQEGSAGGQDSPQPGGTHVLPQGPRGRLSCTPQCSLVCSQTPRPSGSPRNPCARCQCSQLCRLSPVTLPANWGRAPGPTGTHHRVETGCKQGCWMHTLQAPRYRLLPNCPPQGADDH